MSPSREHVDSNKPPSPNERGGTSETRKGLLGELITGRDVAIGLGAIVLVGGFVVYLDGRLSEIQSAVHENANGLAVVQTQIAALRRDVERIEKRTERIEDRVGNLEKVSELNNPSSADPDKLALR